MARTAPARTARRPGARPRALAAALGVTRVARVTGLDRTGVEVACAVRPGGHVLQVTNGKGLSFAAAARGALCEAAELACAERVDVSALALASPAELDRSGVRHVEPAALGGAPATALRLAWRRARDLARGEEVLVPAAAAHAPPAGGPLLGLCGVRWTTNGMGAHASWSAALLHALLEAVERDQLARALPGGFTDRAVAARRLPRGRVARLAPRAALLARRIERRGFEVHLVDARPRDGVGLPVAAALLFDAERGPVPLTAGYCCRLSWEAALTGAILEAAQSRVTDIHGAREDVAGMREADVERMRRACGTAARGERDPERERELDLDRDPDLGPDPDPDRDPDRNPSPSPRTQGEGDEAVRRVLHLLHRAGHPRVLALDLAPPDLPVRVAKVIVPGLLLSDLL